MTLKKRTARFTASSAKNIGLGASYGRVVGYNLFSSADTSVSLAVVDRDGRTIATEASADFTNTTGKDGVFRNLEAETRVTEDGTSATGNAGGGGVLARSPLTVTPAGLGSGYLDVEFYVEV